MKSKYQQTLEEAYATLCHLKEEGVDEFHDRMMKQEKEDLLKLLVDTIKEREESLKPDGQEGIEYDTLDQEVDRLWAKLEGMGFTTKQLNQHCQQAGVL